MTRSALIFALVPVWVASAWGRTLEVGPDQAYQLPSQAVVDARSGDVIDIRPGQYFDCAIIRQDDLVIQGTGAGVILTDKTCQGKALLVVDGANVTIRELTLQRARVPDGNGAGIRAEGGNLTVERSRFLNNENGILSANSPNAVIRIIDSEFVDNGSCKQVCAHGIYINHVALLHVERSRFYDTREGHHIKSRAHRTEILDNQIEDGPTGTSSYLIDIPNGGTAIVTGNRMEKGPRSSNPANTIMIGEEGVDQPTTDLVVGHNVFVNDQDRVTVFVHNVTATPAAVIGNSFKGRVRPLEGDGSVD